MRLKPIGKKHQISFRVVVAEKRKKLNGPIVEDVGFYNPRTDKFQLKEERIKYWLANGVQPTDTVFNLLVEAKILPGPKKVIKIKKKESKEKIEETEEVKESKIEEKAEENQNQ